MVPASMCTYFRSQVNISSALGRLHDFSWYFESTLLSVQTAGTCGYGEELSSSIDAGNFLLAAKFAVSFSRRTLLHGVSK
jgi:hypothetical protein